MGRTWSLLAQEDHLNRCATLRLHNIHRPLVVNYSAAETELVAVAAETAAIAVAVVAAASAVVVAIAAAAAVAAAAAAANCSIIFFCLIS